MTSSVGTKNWSHITASTKQKYAVANIWMRTNPLCLCSWVKISSGNSLIAGGMQWGIADCLGAVKYYILLKHKNTKIYK